MIIDTCCKPLRGFPLLPHVGHGENDTRNTVYGYGSGHWFVGRRGVPLKTPICWKLQRPLLSNVMSSFPRC